MTTQALRAMLPRCGSVCYDLARHAPCMRHALPHAREAKDLSQRLMTNVGLEALKAAERSSDIRIEVGFSIIFMVI